MPNANYSSSAVIITSSKPDKVPVVGGLGPMFSDYSDKTLADNTCFPSL